MSSTATTTVEIDGKKYQVPRASAASKERNTMAKEPTPIGPRTGQQTIPGTEPKIPAGILRQARKVLDLRDQAELAKKRSEASLDFLHAAMARAGLARFVLDEADMTCPITFRIDQQEPKVKLDGYKKPELAGGEDLGAAIG